MIFEYFRRNRPLVSLIMPAYNAERFISQAIESVCKQRYKNWELIIVDDSSIDKTKEIIDVLAKQESRIKVLKNEKNQGIAKARNRALRNASGEFIGHLDADDMLKKNALSTMVKEFSRNNVSLLYSGFVAIDDQNKSIKKCLASEFEREKIAEIGWQHFGMYKKDAALAVGGFNEKLITCSDGDLFVRIARKFPCQRVKKYLYFYRWHGKNIGRSRPHCLDCSKKKVCNYFKEWTNTN